MPPFDPIGTLVSVAGVSLIVFLVWLATRREAPLALGGEAGARDWLSRELAGFQVGKVAVDASGRRALAVSADGREIALVFVMGRRPNFWRLPASKVGKLTPQPASEGKLTLEIPTGDFTRPRLSFTFSSPQELEGLGLAEGVHA